MLNEQRVDQVRQKELQNLVSQGYRRAPSIFLEQWLPYLDDFAQKLERPLWLDIDAIEALAQAPSLSRSRAIGWYLQFSYKAGGELFRSDDADLITSFPQFEDVVGIEVIE